MGWTCNIYDQDEKQKLHGTKQDIRDKLLDPGVDGIMLK
jgi:hypothetical protein